MWIVMIIPDENSYKQNMKYETDTTFRESLPQYAMHGDHRHGRSVQEVKYPEEATHGSRQKMKCLHKLSIAGPGKVKLH